MENIFTILSKFDVTIAEDKKKEFEKEILKNYKTVAEVDTIKESLKEAQENLAQRDTDLKDLKEKLEQAGDDKEKLAEATKSLEEMKGKYSQLEKDSEEKMKAKEYEFAVKEKVSALKFTSNAAKKAFTSDVIAKGLKLENGELLGFDDYVSEYKKSDEGVFKNEDNGGDNGKPYFGGQTKGSGNAGEGKPKTLPTFI